jgi:hypothetical protein
MRSAKQLNDDEQEKTNENVTVLLLRPGFPKREQTFSRLRKASNAASSPPLEDKPRIGEIVPPDIIRPVDLKEKKVFRRALAIGWMSRK